MVLEYLDTANNPHEDNKVKVIIQNKERTIFLDNLKGKDYIVLDEVQAKKLAHLLEDYGFLDDY